MKRISTIILAVLLAVSCSSVCFAAGSGDSFGGYAHVFIIGVDGAGAAFSQCYTPNFDRIFADNAFRHDAHTEVVTVSAQNWGSILTGVDYRTHGFTNDSASKTQRGSDSPNHSIFYYAREAFPDARLASYCNWSAINHGIIENDLHVQKVNRKSDALVTEAILHDLRTGRVPKLMFVQFDEVDHAAHSHGGFSYEYYDAVVRADKLIGEIYDTAAALGLMEDSLFLVVADHGETVYGHGGSTPEESSAVLAAAGHSVNRTVLASSVHNRDAAAIALYALGIKQPKHFVSKVPSGLFGKSREKTVAQGPMSETERHLRDSAYFFLRFPNLIASPFDQR